jgi:hypothetical protein
MGVSADHVVGASGDGALQERIVWWIPAHSDRDVRSPPLRGVMAIAGGRATRADGRVLPRACQ